MNVRKAEYHLSNHQVANPWLATWKRDISHSRERNIIERSGGYEHKSDDNGVTKPLS